MFTGTPRMGFAPAAGAPAAGAPADEEAMLEKLFKDAPEYRKRMRRAKALRKRMETLEGMATADTPLGSYAPGVAAHGENWHAIPGAYIPNNAGQMQKAIGALGSAWEGRKGGPLEKAEGEADELQSQKLLEDALIIGRRARARRKGSSSGMGGAGIIPDTYGGY